MRVEKDVTTFLAPPHLKCPDCGTPMRLVAIMPTPKTVPTQADEITYRCDKCKVELKRLSKPQTLHDAR
jgi:DNA-directed RNA polymerase subunit RPC12/RpoP